MVSALFRCDGAAPLGDARAHGVVLKMINTRGPAANLNLRAQSLAGTVLTSVNERAADLVRIASFVYAADQEISRGGPADVYGERWKRRMQMCVPVTDPGFWMAEPVREGVATTLGFLTDDLWTFDFSPAEPQDRQLPLEVSEEQVLGNPDSVVLLSGGADSLCATVEAGALHGKHPVIVSHRPAPNLDARQKRLVGELSRRLPQWNFPHLSFGIHRMRSDAVENTQRSRAFLYASLGTAVAAELGICEVLLSDNGIVSLNLPISGQLVGAMASRGTHPKFVAHFNALMAMVLPGKPAVVNSLWARTRPEALGILQEARCGDLLPLTVSCSRSRGRPAAKPHCGSCSQCVDRRFGAIAAGLEGHDPSDGYGVDIFRDPLPDGEAKTIAESYVRFARDVRETPAEVLFDKFPQLWDCLLPDDPNQMKTAGAHCSLLKRHGQTTLGVMSEVVKWYSSELVHQKVAPDSLVGLAIGLHERESKVEDGAENVFRRKGDYWEITFRGKTVNVRDVRGMASISYLLGHPGEHVHVLDLLALYSGPDAGRRDSLKERSDRGVMSHEGLRPSTPSPDDAVLDDQAMADYRGRYEELTTEVGEAEAEGDQEQIEKIRREMEWLADEVQHAKGLGGRQRTFPDAGEQARKSVSAAITRSRDRIRKDHPLLAEHLDKTLRTGFHCSYASDPPLIWIT